MADEISLSLSCDITKDNLKLFFRPGSISPDLSSSLHDAFTKNISGTTFTQLYSAGNAASNGYMFMQNLSTNTSATSDNIVLAHTSATSNAFLRLRAGEVATFRTGPAPTNYAIATGASGETVTVQVLILSP